MSSHPKMARTGLPDRAKEALRAVRETLNEEAYLVGGAMRDALLGQESEDLELTTLFPPRR